MILYRFIMRRPCEQMEPMPMRSDMEARRFAASLANCIRVETTAERVVWRRVEETASGRAAPGATV